MSARVLPDGARPLRVASYNIHRAVGLDGRRDPGRIAAVLREIDADILGLQEVDWHDAAGGTETQVEYLAHLPGYAAVLGPNLRDHRGHYGNLLLSRGDILGERQIDLSEPGREPRGAIETEIDVGRARLRTLVTHFGLGTFERWRQARRLGDVLAEAPERPTLLLGDFNEWIPGAPTLRPLLSLCDGAARPGSFPARLPVLALDRILLSGVPGRPRIRTHDTPLARQASDHLPVVAEIGPMAPGTAARSSCAGGSGDGGGRST